MEIVEEGVGKVKAKVDGRVVMSALLGRVSIATPGIGGEGVLVVTDFEGKGTLEEVEAAAKLLKEFVGDEELFLGVRKDNPRYEGLIRLYEMLGAESELTVMRW